MSLDALRIAPGRSPRPAAWKQNALLAHLARQRLLGVVDNVGPAPRWPHPWRVRVQRFEPPAESATPLDPAGAWSVFIGAGTINDELPTILYLRNEDPRGWVMPEGYAAGGTDPRWIERDVLDDPDDPPFLIVADPPAGDFTRISDEARPGIERGAFCGEEAWELELWRAHVLLTAAPFRASIFAAELPAPRLVKYRFATVPRLPSANYGGSAGGWVELATLYLLRDPDAPEIAQLLVRQREWWSLWGVVAQPGGELVNIFDAAAEGTGTILPAGFTDLLRDQLEDTLQGAAQTHFWSV